MIEHRQCAEIELSGRPADEFKNMFKEGKGEVEEEFLLSTYHKPWVIYYSGKPRISNTSISCPRLFQPPASARFVQQCLIHVFVSLVL
jgi:hypothetical protein